MEYGTYIENGSAAPRQGYLSGDYRLFHLTDSGPRDFDPHYHDFCKILILISGSVDYIVEGRTYEPEPGDLVLVNRGEGRSQAHLVLEMSVISAIIKETYPLSPAWRLVT